MLEPLWLTGWMAMGCLATALLSGLTKNETTIEPNVPDSSQRVRRRGLRQPRRHCQQQQKGDKQPFCVGCDVRYPEMRCVECVRRQPQPKKGCSSWWQRNLMALGGWPDGEWSTRRVTQVKKTPIETKSIGAAS